MHSEQWTSPASTYWRPSFGVRRVARFALIESLVTEVVTDPGPAHQAFSVAPTGVADALRTALEEQDEEVTRTLFARQNGLADGVYSAVVDIPVPPGGLDTAVRDLRTIGWRLRWYGAAPGWALRLVLGRLAGERQQRWRPDALVEGARVDWWRVARASPGKLMLRSMGWMPGDAWLAYRLDGGRLRQVAAFRARGLPGFLYWKLLKPVHRVAFAQMARRRVRAMSGARWRTPARRVPTWPQG